VLLFLLIEFFKVTTILNNFKNKNDNVLVISNGNLSLLFKKIIYENAVLKHNVGLANITQFIPLNIKKLKI
jgi:hypothetical protein